MQQHCILGVRDLLDLYHAQQESNSQICHTLLSPFILYTYKSFKRSLERESLPEQGDAAPAHGETQHRLGHADGLELELAAEAERAVAEERHGHDGPLEDVDGVHVRHDAAAGLVVVNHGAVHEALRDDAARHQGLNDELVHPRRDLVHLALGVESLLPGAALLQLRAVRVALAEEVLVAQRRAIHRVLPVQAPVPIRHHIVDLCLDARALLGREHARLGDAALHFARLGRARHILLLLTLVLVRGVSALALFDAAVLLGAFLALVVLPVRRHRLQLVAQIREAARRHFW